MSRPLGVILVYHRVESRPRDPFRMAVEPERFREHLEVVCRNHRPTALADIDRGSSEPGNVALTFDDGYANVLHVVSPLLLEYGVPATFFVNSSAVGSHDERFWDRLEQAVFDPERERLEFEIRGESVAWSLASDAERERAFREAHARLMHADVADRESVLGRLATFRSFSNREELRSLGEDELRELAGRPGHAIGAHGEHHLFLPAHPLEMRRRELWNDKRQLETWLGAPVSSLAYAFGASDSETEALARELGFDCALRADPQPVTREATRWAWPRIDAASLTGAELARELRRHLNHAE